MPRAELAVRDGLVRRGLVDRRRGSADKRVVLLSLTPDGEQAVEAALRIGGLRAHIAQRLTAEQIDQLAGLLSLLVADTAAGIAVAARFPAMRTMRAAGATR